MWALIWGAGMNVSLQMGDSYHNVDYNSGSIEFIHSRALCTSPTSAQKQQMMSTTWRNPKNESLALTETHSRQLLPDTEWQQCAKLSSNQKAAIKNLKHETGLVSTSVEKQLDDKRFGSMITSVNLNVLNKSSWVSSHLSSFFFSKCPVRSFCIWNTFSPVIRAHSDEAVVSLSCLCCLF